MAVFQFLGSKNGQEHDGVECLQHREWIVKIVTTEGCLVG